MTKPTHVLVVDDDPSLLEMYRARMVAEHFAVTTATDGEKALARTMDDPPDIILLDLKMPSVSGLEVLEILKTTKKTKKIPVIVLTALGDDQLRQDALDRGAADYLLKADTMPAQVVENIREVLK